MEKTTKRKTKPKRPLVEKRMSKNKEQLLVALKECLGIVTMACEMCGIKSTNTFYLYYNNDKEFRDRVEEVKETVIDFVEHSLLTQIKAGETTATIFYLKTKGKHRGYAEVNRTSLEISEETAKVITGMQIK